MKEDPESGGRERCQDPRRSLLRGQRAAGGNGKTRRKTRSGRSLGPRVAGSARQSEREAGSPAPRGSRLGRNADRPSWPGARRRRTAAIPQGLRDPITARPCSLPCPVVNANGTHLSRTGWKGDFNCCGGESGGGTRSLSARVGERQRQVGRGATRASLLPGPSRQVPPRGQGVHQKHPLLRPAGAALSRGPRALASLPEFRRGSPLSRAPRPPPRSFPGRGPAPSLPPNRAPRSGSGFLAMDVPGRLTWERGAAAGRGLVAVEHSRGHSHGRRRRRG